MNVLSISPTDWNEQIANLPSSHLLQTWEWGQVKAHFGWKAMGVVWNETAPGKWEASVVEFKPGDLTELGTHASINHGYTKPRDGQIPTSQPAAAALVLQRDLSFGAFTARLRVLYIPKGPLLEWANVPLRRKVLADLQTLSRQRGAIFIKIDPDVCLGEGVPGLPGSQENPVGLQVTTDLQERGWHFSDEQIQFRNTVLLDLSPSDEELLTRMKQKTRYNLRLAERKGVSVRVGTPADWGLLYRMYAETSLRDGFVIRDEGYYHTVWETFSGQPASASFGQPVMEALIAMVADEPVAAVLIYRFAGKAWYLSGMSVETHREKMPNYLLQWEAIRRAKASGCTVYDLWGAPDEFIETDPLWGVFRFKEGLVGRVVRTLGAWDYPAMPTFYRWYTQVLPRLLGVMRRRGKAQTRQRMLGS